MNKNYTLKHFTLPTFKTDVANKIFNSGNSLINQKETII